MCFLSLPFKSNKRNWNNTKKKKDLSEKTLFFTINLLIIKYLQNYLIDSLFEWHDDTSKSLYFYALLRFPLINRQIFNGLPSCNSSGNSSNGKF